MDTPNSDVLVVSADSVEGLFESALAVEKLDDEKSQPSLASIIEATHQLLLGNQKELIGLDVLELEQVIAVLVYLQMVLAVLTRKSPDVVELGLVSEDQAAHRAVLLGEEFLVATEPGLDAVSDGRLDVTVSESEIHHFREINALEL